MTIISNIIKEDTTMKRKTKKAYSKTDFNMYDARTLRQYNKPCYWEEDNLRFVSEVTDMLMEGLALSDEDFDAAIAMLDNAGNLSFNDFNVLCDAFGVPHNRV